MYMPDASDALKMRLNEATNMFADNFKILQKELYSPDIPIMHFDNIMASTHFLFLSRQ